MEAAMAVAWETVAAAGGGRAAGTEAVMKEMAAVAVVMAMEEVAMMAMVMAVATTEVVVSRAACAVVVVMEMAMPEAEAVAAGEVKAVEMEMVAMEMVASLAAGKAIMTVVERAAAAARVVAERWVAGTRSRRRILYKHQTCICSSTSANGSCTNPRRCEAQMAVEMWVAVVVRTYCRHCTTETNILRPNPACGTCTNLGTALEAEMAAEVAVLQAAANSAVAMMAVLMAFVTREGERVVTAAMEAVPTAAVGMVMATMVAAGTEEALEAGKVGEGEVVA